MPRMLLGSCLFTLVGACAPAAEALIFSQQPTLLEVPHGDLHASIAALPADAQAKALQLLADKPVADVESLRVTTTGHVWYKCCDLDHSALLAQIPAQNPPAITSKAAVSVDNPPKRHSKAGAPKIIYLDFNGGTVTGTEWNTSRGITSWKAKPYSTDADFTTFSDAEQANIIAIWERVAQDYSSFDVDVTTEQPTLGPNTAWAMITGIRDVDGKPLPHAGAGGVAFVNVFGRADFQKLSPAWVTDYGSNDVDATAAIADATSHEVGHNLGLSHDGNSQRPYESGFSAGSDAPSWGPLMGAPYGMTVSHWSKGDYVDANNKEDDLAIIAKNLPLVSDDHGGPSNPTGLTIAGKAFSSSGLIGNTDDKDSFRLSFGQGAMTATVTTYNTTGTTNGGNLKARLTLASANGAVIATSAANAGTGATLATNVEAGTYILTVDTVICGTPLASRNGFTTYGNMGTYTLKGTGEQSSTNNGTDSGGGGAVIPNNNAGGQGTDRPMATYDGAQQGNGGGGCGLGSSLGALLCAMVLMFLRMTLRKP